MLENGVDDDGDDALHVLGNDVLPPLFAGFSKSAKAGGAEES